MKIPSNKLLDIAQYFRNELTSVYSSDEIEIFIQYCFEEFTGISKANILLEPGRTVSESDLLKFHFAVKDLKRGRPIQYILGKTSFYGKEILVSEATLIPRPETEELVREVIEFAQNHQESFSILDIGTGSGAIAVTLKDKIERCHMYALDVSVDALALAKQNALKRGVEIHFVLQDILNPANDEKLPSVSVLVSNPPYVLKKEMEKMNRNVTEHEPHLALFVPDDNSLVFYKRIAELGKTKLKSGGKIFVEINEALGIETCILFQKEGYSDVQLKTDLQGKDRIVIASL